MNDEHNEQRCVCPACGNSKTKYQIISILVFNDYFYTSTYFSDPTNNAGTHFGFCNAYVVTLGVVMN